jgi:hypothetical protein
MTKSDLIRVAVFEGKHIRKIMKEGEWWFSVIDIVEVLTGSNIPKRYWSDLKRKLAKEGYSELYDKIVQLKFAAADGKYYATDCANTETMFRIIQSIPSPKVEPFKQWLARVGYERLEEIENPELSMERMQALYEKKGYPGRCGCVAARVPVQSGESECPVHPGEHTAGGAASQVEPGRHPSNEAADGQTQASSGLKERTSNGRSFR